MSEQDNRAWADEYIRRKANDFRYRWELFDELIAESMPTSGVWLDIGCGDNALISRLAGAHVGPLGIDIARHPELADQRFLMASVYDLPIESDSVGLITLRFVAEHLEWPQQALAECARILQPGGRVVVMTTNKLSPIIFPVRLMPFGFKHWLAGRLFGGEAHDLQPTYHRLNSHNDFVRNLSGLRIESFDYVQDGNYYRKPIFRMHVCWHRLTKALGLPSLRTNLLVVLQKDF
jgi:ubiquinone/menaquinone biosynthesis C-methylase UbiE